MIILVLVFGFKIFWKYEIIKNENKDALAKFNYPFIIFASFMISFFVEIVLFIWILFFEIF